MSFKSYLTEQKYWQQMIDRLEKRKAALQKKPSSQSNRNKMINIDSEIKRLRTLNSEG